MTDDCQRPFKIQANIKTEATHIEQQTFAKYNTQHLQSSTTGLQTSIKRTKYGGVRNFRPKSKGKQQLPTQHVVNEEQDSCQLLNSTLPQKNVNRIVHLLYKNLVRKSKKEAKPEVVVQSKDPVSFQGQSLLKNSSLQQMQNNIKSLGQLGDACGKSVAFFRDDDYLKKYSRPALQEKYNKKRLVAQVICKSDYGVAFLDQQILNSKSQILIDRNEYKTIAFSVATETYRKIQTFLNKQCGKKIKPINRQDLRSIFSIILNCRSYFEQPQCETMLKFISAQFGISNITISEQEAQRLYKALQEKLKMRITNKHINPIYPKDSQRVSRQYRFRSTEQIDVFKLDQIWNNGYEVQLLELYKIDQHFSHIRDYFIEVHPEHKSVFTMDAFRSRFCKIMRSALKKIYQLSLKHRRELPALIKMNDLRIKLIQRSPEGKQIRFKLIDAYLSSENDLKMLRDIILMINGYIQMKEQDRSNLNHKKYKTNLSHCPNRKRRRRRSYILPLHADQTHSQFLINLQDELLTLPNEKQMEESSNVQQSQVEQNNLGQFEIYFS